MKKSKKVILLILGAVIITGIFTITVNAATNIEQANNVKKQAVNTIKDVITGQENVVVVDTEKKVENSVTDTKKQEKASSKESKKEETPKSAESTEEIVVEMMDSNNKVEVKQYPEEQKEECQEVPFDEA